MTTARFLLRSSPVIRARAAASDRRSCSAARISAWLASGCTTRTPTIASTATCTCCRSWRVSVANHRHRRCPLPRRLHASSRRRHRHLRRRRMPMETVYRISRICVPRRRAANVRMSTAAPAISRCRCTSGATPPRSPARMRSRSTVSRIRCAVCRHSAASLVATPTARARKPSMSICHGAVRWRSGTIWRREASTSRSSRWLATANLSRSRTTPRLKAGNRTVAWS